VRVVVIQRAVLIAFGNVRSAQHSLGPALDSADAILCKLTAVLLHHSQARAAADHTNFRRGSLSKVIRSRQPETVCCSRAQLVWAKRIWR
jgi:hypothetical protein